MPRLPPFFALRALEAAARHRSYSRAANELAVTHSAVSHQIRRLEAELGARLFERSGNAMIPRPEAQTLAAAVRRSLDLLNEAVGAVGAAADRDPLVVSLHPQFASRWLAARLPALLAHRAGARLEIRVEERCADFVADGADMAVRHGLGEWPGLEAAPLIEEHLFPVASPAVARTLKVAAPADLIPAPLLHHREIPWSRWFAAFGLKAPLAQGLVADDSLMLLEAAAQHHGVALACGSLVEPDLRAGRLVRLLPHDVPAERGFHAVWRADSRKLARIWALRDWLAAEAAGARRCGCAA